ncbi:MAG: 16S rRNA methyltransferase [Ignisphaera sp.]
MMAVIRPLTIVIAEAGLELIPKEIEEHPLVKVHAKKRGKKPSEVILDISLHYKAMRNLDNWFKRGRPDIVHTSLLIALSSVLNRAGLLRVYIHTINNLIVHVDPRVRIPRNYNRFVGLMEQLLIEKKVPPNSQKPLLLVEEKRLDEFIKENRFDYVVLLHEKGELIKPSVFGEIIGSKMAKGEKTCIIIGGFQRGDFEQFTLSLTENKVAIYKQPLETWTVLSMVIHSIENAKELDNVLWY